MSSVVYVIDREFTNRFSDELKKSGRGAPYEDLTAAHVGEFFLISRPDGLDPRKQVAWGTCIDPLLEHVAPHSPTRLVVLGHKGIFRGMMPGQERYDAECRVRSAEASLRELLPQPVPSIWVYGFHHELQSSEIWQLLESPGQLMVPGTLARLRSIVEEGGGPLGRLSALKHELMRPFASVRLRLQVEAERGSRRLDPESIDRVVTAIDEGRRQLLHIRESFEQTRNFERALDRAHGLLDEDLQAITSDPDRFNGWIDRLNDALDAVREAC